MTHPQLGCYSPHQGLYLSETAGLSGGFGSLARLGLGGGCFAMEKKTHEFGYSLL